MGVLRNLQTILGEKPKPEQPSKPTPQKKLLIVEDEPILREMYKDKFTIEGFNVMTAENGQVGLDQIAANKPDIVLLDLMMPVMDGETMLLHLRKIPEFKTLPVFVLTNAGEAEHIRNTKLYYNAIEFIIKSNVSLEEIVNKVKRLL